MNRIKSISHIFRVLFQWAFLMEIVLLIAFWVNGAHPFELGFFTADNLQSSSAPHTAITFGFLPEHINIPIQYPLTIQTKILGFLVSCIPTGITLSILYCLIQLFRLYEHAEIFTLLNVRYLKKIGYLLLASALVEPFYEILISAALTLQNGHGHRYAMASFGTFNMTLIFTGLMVILIAWIMAEGCKLQDEQAHTI